LERPCARPAALERLLPRLAPFVEDREPIALGVVRPLPGEVPAGLDEDLDAFARLGYAGDERVFEDALAVADRNASGRRPFPGRGRGGRRAGRAPRRSSAPARPARAARTATRCGR